VAKPKQKVGGKSKTIQKKKKLNKDERKILKASREKARQQ